MKRSPGQAMAGSRSDGAMAGSRSDGARLRISEGFHIQKSLINNTVWNTIGTIVYFACQWLITLIVVWLYDDFANAGNLALAMNITNIFYCIAIYNIRAYQVSDIQGEFSDSVYITARVITCFGAFLLCAAFVLASGYRTQQVLIILCYMGFRTVETFVDVLHGIVHKHRRLDIAGISLISRGILMLGAFYVMGRMFDLLPAIAGMAIITALFVIFYDIPNARKFVISAPCKLQHIRALLKRCFPLMLVFLMITFFVSYTRFSIERIRGEEALGAYAAATTPAIAVQVAMSFFIAPLTSLFSDCVEGSDKARFNKIFAAAFGLAAVLTLAALGVALIAGRWGLELLFGTDILPYTYLLPGAMVVTGLTASLWLMNVVFTTVRDIRGLFFACLAGVAVCIAATEVFLREFGLIGANYAMIACQGAVLLILIIRFLMILRDADRPEA